MEAREAACRALLQVEKGAKSNEVIHQYLEGNSWQDPRDRGLFTRLFLGTLQNRLFLDHCINEVSNTPVDKMKPFIRNLLRLSAYQLCFLDAVPASAVCNEAVKLAKKNGFSGLSGFVNAICRRLSNTIKEAYHACGDPGLKHSFPDWIREELEPLVGPGEVASVMAAFQGEESPLTARFHLSGAPQEDILELLQQQGIRAQQAPYAKNAWYLMDHPAPGQVEAFRQGLIQYQDLTSILAVEALDLQPGERVLDLCAAPGGKTVAAADLVGPVGSVTSCDVSEAKLEKIRENAARCGFPHIILTLNDATLFRPEWEGSFDAVLADLPCSGLGTLGHKPEVRYRVTPEDVTALGALQRTMLTQAVTYLKPGGRLLFSTCTFARKENMVNTAFLADQPQLEPLPLALPLAKGDHALLLLPHLFDVGDGFYIACFRRR